jgi:hypothetical protein
MYSFDNIFHLKCNVEVTNENKHKTPSKNTYPNCTLDTEVL